MAESARTATAGASQVPRGRSIRSLAWRNRLVRVGGAIIAVEVVVAALSSFIVPYSPIEIVGGPLLPPGSPGHLLGTDEIGRDLLSRVVAGAPVSLVEGLVVVAIAMSLAIPLGLIAVEVPRLDGPIMRVMDSLLAFPGMLLALAFVAVLGPSLPSVLFAVGLSSVAPAVVLVRATARAAASEDYVLAARSLGASRLRVATRHVLPNILAPLLVSSTFRIATALLVTTGLSFLGMGAQPPAPEWGSMLAGGRDLLYVAPWVTTFPGLAILFTVFGFNLLGDGLRDVLDPRLQV